MSLFFKDSLFVFFLSFNLLLSNFLLLLSFIIVVFSLQNFLSLLGCLPPWGLRVFGI